MTKGIDLEIRKILVNSTSIANIDFDNDCFDDNDNFEFDDRDESDDDELESYKFF